MAITKKQGEQIAEQINKRFSTLRELENDIDNLMYFLHFIPNDLIPELTRQNSAFFLKSLKSCISDVEEVK